MAHEHPKDAPVASVRGLTAGYGTKIILSDLDVDLHPGVLTCICGGSGCGKSTLLNVIMGMLPPMSGEVRLLGRDLTALGEDERAELLGRVGMMFQYGALLNSISLRENLTIPLVAHTQLSATVIEQVIRMKLGIVHLQHAIDKLPGELSGGMRKRAGLSRAIVLDPDVLFCDEPSAGLDPNTAADIDTLLLQLKSLFGMTIVVITHELSSIRLIADRIIYLKDGGVHFHGPLDDALASDDPTLRAFFHRAAEDAGRPGRSLLREGV
ncbi:MAG: phospholipid/cholesterol/gamma-HCH transport system ATP-binding protein [Myxococcota bacterium]|jgi:phospholipid/cholesterol/gamma-HCH transport system ATP-binding protein